MRNDAPEDMYSKTPTMHYIDTLLNRARTMWRR